MDGVSLLLAAALVLVVGLVGVAVGLWWGRRSMASTVAQARQHAVEEEQLRWRTSGVDQARLHALESAVEGLSANATKTLAASAVSTGAAQAMSKAAAPPVSAVVTARAAAALMDPDIFKPAPASVVLNDTSNLAPLGLRLIDPNTIRLGTKNLLISPVHGTPDDLTLIRGVASDTVQALHHIGVYYHWQIAAWTSDDAAQVEALLKTTHGRIQRDAWVSQSAQFLG
jgi:hypothetical protein